MKYLILMCLFMLGCQQTPGQRVGTAFVTHRVVTNSMSVLAESDKLDLETAETFEQYRAPAWDLIVAAKEDVLDGDDDTFTATQALDMLIPILKEMEDVNARAASNSQRDP